MRAATVRAAGTLLLVASSATACSGEADKSTAPTPSAIPSTSRSSAPSTSPGQRRAASAPRDLPGPTPAREAFGRIELGGILRAGNGSTLLLFGPTWPHERTGYRIYDRRWRPQTPLLEVPVSLDLVRATATGFLAQATRSRRDGSTTLNAWVVIDRAGQLREATQQRRHDSAPAQLRADDLRFGYAGQFAYRPDTRTVLRARRPSWFRQAVAWSSRRGPMVCAFRPHGRAPDAVLHVSADEGRTFSTISAGAVIPDEGGARVQTCLAVGDRVLIMAGAENPRWLHTIDRSDHRLLSSHPLGKLLNGYAWDTLPDGRLVVGTNRSGVFVATDATNRRLDFRPGPVPPDTQFEVVGEDIFLARGRRVQVSPDAGRTWKVIDLQLPHS